MWLSCGFVRRCLWREVPRPVETARVAAYLGEQTTQRALLVVGANGVGKTTVVRAALRALQPDSDLLFEFDANATEDAASPFAARLAAFELDVLTRLSALKEQGGPLLSYADVFTLLGRAGGRADIIWPFFVKRLKDPTQTHFRRSLHTTFAPPEKLAARLSNTAFEATSWLDVIKSAQRPAIPVSRQLLVAYDLLCAHERLRGQGQRTGRLVQPFLMDLLLYVAQHSSYRPKLVVNNAATRMYRKASHEADWVDQLLLRFTDANSTTLTTATASSVPVLVDTADARFARSLLDDMLLPFSNVSGRFEFVQVFGLKLEQIRLFFVPDPLKTADDAQTIHKLLGGSLEQLQRFLTSISADQPINEQLARLLSEHYVAVARRIDDCISRCAFDDGTTSGVDTRFMDVLSRLRDVSYVVNVSDDMGLALLQNEAVKILIDEGLLYHQLAPAYLRPCTRADADGISFWLDERKRRMSFAQRLAFRWHRTFRGVGSLRRLMYENIPELAPPMPHT